jgi:hypothetical protein
MLTGEVEYGTNVHMHLLHEFPDRAPVTFSWTWVRKLYETKNKYEFAFATRKIKAGSGDTVAKQALHCVTFRELHARVPIRRINFRMRCYE